MGQESLTFSGNYHYIQLWRGSPTVLQLGTRPTKEKDYWNYFRVRI